VIAVRRSVVLIVLLLLVGCGKDAEHYLEEGNAYLRKRDMANAIAMFERAVEIAPENHEAQNSLGTVLAVIGDFKRAVGHFRAAVAAKETFVEGHYNLGRTLVELGQNEEALGEFERTVQLDSTYALAHLGSGDILAGLGMPERAARSYQKAIRFDPGLRVAYAQLSSVYIGMGEYDKGAEVLLEARTLHPDDAEVVSMAGRVAMLKRDFDGALGLFTEAVKMDSTNLLYRNDLATALMLNEQKEQALLEWRKILAASPGPELEQIVRQNLERALADTSG
jgi:tetratricopeptide (TPR) repeat protein